MKQPTEILQTWVDLFNQYDADKLAALYSEDCINHQTPNGIVQGREAIREMFQREFEQFDMVCLVENIFQDGNVGMLEWKDPKGLRGCGFFWIENGQIVYQRGYWDKLSFMNQQADNECK